MLQLLKGLCLLAVDHHVLVRLMRMVVVMVWIVMLIGRMLTSCPAIDCVHHAQLKAGAQVVQGVAGASRSA